MKTIGLITEYNPFHNGHKYHLEKSKEITNADNSIIIMSGHFLQRGIPAVMDKWTRAQQALEAGADLVIELPLVYSLNSAEYFAHGAVKILDSINIVDEIIFGSESGDIKNIKDQAKIFSNEPEEFTHLLKDYLSNGLSFPQAREKAYIEYSNKEKTIENQPNNILGLEYAKAIYDLKSNINLNTIKRKDSGYFSNEISTISSATAIRKYIKNNSDLSNLKITLPKFSYKSIVNYKSDFVFRDDFEDLIFYKLRTMDKEKLKRIHDVSEGLENRIIEMAIKSNTLEELIQNIKTKRYTYTRIQRILFKAIFDISNEYKNYDVPYIRLLGFNKKGMKLINKINDSCEIPIITNLKNYEPQNKIAKEMINLDIKATNIYKIFSNPNKKNAGDDFKKNPIIKA